MFFFSLFSIILIKTRFWELGFRINVFMKWHFFANFADMKLHIFNPDHDLALAANLRNFTAPHAGRQLRSDLSYIPAIWADEGDFVLVDDIDNARDKVRHIIGHEEKVEFITKLQLAKVFTDTFLIDSVHPWGWNLSLKQELSEIGCPEIMLPTNDNLDKIRTLSSRQWAATHLQENVAFVSNADDLLSIMSQQEKVVIKAPWSSSGRGVRYLTREEMKNGLYATSIGKWILNVIDKQGGVSVEPYYNKVLDFGMEFELKSGEITYRGLSLFQTVKNAYSGNVLESEEEKMDFLRNYLDTDALYHIQEDMKAKLQPYLKDTYCGPFGIDMMVCSEADTGKLFINSCVELNLRRTMGHVALDLTERLNKRPHLMRVAFDGNRYHLEVLPGRPSEDAPIH